MASVTRSTRRAEGLHPHQGVGVNANGGGGPLTRSGPALFPQHQQQGQGQGQQQHTQHTQHHQLPHHQLPPQYQHGGRTKRALEAGEQRGLDAINKPKRSRIAVEILARPPLSHTHTFTHTHTQTLVHPPPVPSNAVARPVATVNRGTQHTKQAQHLQPTAQLDSETDPNLTKHQAKVINGIKHELDRLQPQPKDTKEPGRKLRSQEATRFKSELSAYFPDYDEVIGNDPKEQHTLNLETPIVVVDSSPRRAVPDPPRAGALKTPLQQSHSIHFPPRGYGDALFTDVFDAQRIDFGFLEAQHKNKNLDDPLPDSLFEPVHKRAERLERSIRNTEKGRAQHEKDQIIRLLEGLQGHDWLRVMGVSGITETKKRTFEPARAHFVRGCQAILSKFRSWSLEEKRRKQEKDRALAELAEEEQIKEEEEQAEAEKQVEQGIQDDAEEDAEKVVTSQDDASEASSPAKQLRQEAMARSKLAAANSKRPRPTARPTSPKPPEPPKEFKSFFTKKYERDGALNRHRRAGRKVLAWGHPIPEMPEADFVLPEDYLDDDVLKSRERRKRRDRRGSRN